ncbi:MAG: endonuclease/exonuclease/phosphatase family protein [Candidatus Sericytochromatia bacterium]
MKKPIRHTLKPAARQLPPLYWPSVVLAVLLSGLSLSNHFGEVHPGLDLVGQFKTQFALALLLPLLLMALMRRWHFVFGLLVCLSLNVAEILPWFVPVGASKAQSSLSSGREVKIFQANVLNTNSNVSTLARQIVQEQPDIVILLEFHPQHLTMMNGLGRAYPYRFAPPNKQYFGLGVWSRYPMNKTLLRFLGQAELPTLETRLEVDTQELHLLVTHLDSPVRVPALRRNRQLSALGKHLQDIRPPL